MGFILVVNSILVIALLVVLRFTKDYASDNYKFKFVLTWLTVCSMVAWIINFVLSIVSVFG